MDVSGISLSMMKAMNNIAKTDPEEVAERVISRNDKDGDGALTLAELGVDQDEFTATDTNGDGVVSQEELVARITQRLNDLTGLVLDSAESTGITQLKNLFETLSAESEDESSYNTILNLLTQLGVSSEDTNNLIALLEENGIDVTA
ncbi:MAG: hypothetical protein JXB62_02790 [Pirellulales bacterium]|nr:hypothetical protein [Pirellulales bacterium]